MAYGNSWALFAEYSSNTWPVRIEKARAQGSFSGKPPAQVAVLAESVAAVEQLFQAEREKVKQLEGRLVEVEKQLGASRGSLLASNVEIENLRKQLSVATQNGMSPSP